MKLFTYILFIACSLHLAACGIQKQISKEAQKDILSNSDLSTAHIGICVYDANAKKYLYNYQGNKYFIPASNTKIFTCYAAMKYLGDSLVGLRYYRGHDSIVVIVPTGDPTFLHQDFKNQPVFEFLKKEKNVILPEDSVNIVWQTTPLGSGWAWDDYNDDFMVERSPFPIFGNVVRFTLKEDSLRLFYNKNNNETTNNLIAEPSFFKDLINADTIKSYKNFYIKRNLRFYNLFYIKSSNLNFDHQTIPFATLPSFSMDLLKDTMSNYFLPKNNALYFSYGNISGLDIQNFSKGIIHSQPTDSLLKIMMHRSDNFYAEQSLLMVSNEKLGVMNDEKIIDTLLNNDLKALPQKPRWVDGSGLSRYNLFSPEDFVFVLDKMRNEFSWNRITAIFPTGGEGTLKNYLQTLNGKIFAKTGSLSNNATLSGYLITKKSKTLIFSILVNNHKANAADIRKASESFLQSLYEKY